MGRFIITRTAAGVRFLLQSEKGRTLATSRYYATMDACKKGIASLVANAATMPVVDATAGERAPNPKFEVVAAGSGYAFFCKAPNGRTVIASGSYATKKATLRAISMLRTGTESPVLLFSREAGLSPLTMPSPTRAAEAPVTPDFAEDSVDTAEAPVAPDFAEDSVDTAEAPVALDFTEDSADAAEAPVTPDFAENSADTAEAPVAPDFTVDSVDTAEAPVTPDFAEDSTATKAPVSPAAAAPTSPRLIRVGSAREGVRPPSREPQKSTPRRTSLLERLFKNK